MWIKDCHEVMINLNKFTRIYWISIEDTKRENSVAFYKFLLDDLKNDYELGYLDSSYSPEDVIEQISKGCSFGFDTFHRKIYYYLDKLNEFEKDDDQDFEIVYERNNNLVDLEIKRKRFVETE